MPVLTAARVTIVAGKGGVGKTTVTAVLARAAADAGRRVLVVELDGKPVLGALAGDIPCETILAPAALEEYLRAHGFGRFAKRLSSTGVIKQSRATELGSRVRMQMQEDPWLTSRS